MSPKNSLATLASSLYSGFSLSIFSNKEVLNSFLRSFPCVNLFAVFVFDSSFGFEKISTIHHLLTEFP